MVISIKANFSKESGMVVEKYYSQMRQFKKEFGYKTKNNDIYMYYNKGSI